MVDSDTVWPTEEHLRQPELREAIQASPAASTFYPLGMKEAGYSYPSACTSRRTDLVAARWPGVPAEMNARDRNDLGSAHRL